MPGERAKIKTIKAGLAQLPAIGPSTLLVSGTCQENVLIQGYQFLTVQGNPMATIDGGRDSTKFRHARDPASAGQRSDDQLPGRTTDKPVTASLAYSPA